MLFKNKRIENGLRIFFHKFVTASLRLKLYWIPYLLYTGFYIHTIDLDNVPVFTYIGIETINRCNGKCSFCPVNIKQPQRPYAKMTDEIFNSIINRWNKYI